MGFRKEFIEKKLNERRGQSTKVNLEGEEVFPYPVYLVEGTKNVAFLLANRYFIISVYLKTRYTIPNIMVDCTAVHCLRSLPVPSPFFSYAGSTAVQVDRRACPRRPRSPGSCVSGWLWRSKCFCWIVNYAEMSHQGIVKKHYVLAVVSKDQP